MHPNKYIMKYVSRVWLPSITLLDKLCLYISRNMDYLPCNLKLFPIRLINLNVTLKK